MSRFGPTCATEAAAASVWHVAHVLVKSARPVASALRQRHARRADARLVKTVGDRDGDRDAEAEGGDERDRGGANTPGDLPLRVQLAAKPTRAPGERQDEDPAPDDQPQRQYDVSTGRSLSDAPDRGAESGCRAVGVWRRPVNRKSPEVGALSVAGL